ncbi:MAG: hypothetical protein HYR97_07605 [Candidatus Melainabacteria bacterium]|nr:hypothetical protein [Candidatus Melainabacteria bacterium]MBI3307811.1 hypothetical protein [Candidatus Melainabacteria bacterium]
MSALRILLGLSIVTFLSFAFLPSYADADEECQTYCKSQGDYENGHLAPDGDVSKCDEGETGIDICCCS